MSIAKIQIQNDLPRLIIDGKEEAPIVFFANTDIMAHSHVSALGIRYSKEADMHLYSVCCVLPTDPIHKVNGKRNFQIAFDALDVAIDNDEQAKILLRVNVSIYGAAAANWAKRYPGDLMEFLSDAEDTTLMVDENGEWVSMGSMVTITSEDWLNEAVETLREFINEVKNSPRYNQHVIGYHIAGAETGEWFHYQMRERGLDISKTNERCYRNWLKNKYKEIEVLHDAWGTKEYKTFEDIALPLPIPGNDRSQKPTITLFTRDTDEKYIDYSKYCSEIMADRILKLAHAARQATNHEKLIVFFYGYYFDLYDARTGHFCLNKILESPDIDAISSPISYTDRNEGGVGGYMSPVDSIHMHGKLWLVENDIRTFMVARKSPFFDWCKPVESMEHLFEVYKREAGASLAHGTGCWYMDLFAAGWQAHPAIWNCIRTLKDVVEAHLPKSSAIKPDVAILVDEEAMAVSAHAEAVGMNLLYKTRLELYRAGVKFGLYELSDFINGKLEGIKLAVLLNPFDLSEEKAVKIRKRMDEIHCAVLWMHGLGKTSKQAFHIVTGMDMGIISGKMNSLKMQVTEEFLQGRDKDLDLSENQFINEINMKTIGDAGRGNEYQQANPVYYVLHDEGVVATYAEEEGMGKNAFVITKNSAFFGGLSINAPLLIKIAKSFGVHVYNYDRLAMHIGNDVICIHNKDKKIDTSIKLPEKCNVMEWRGLDDGILHTKNNKANMDLGWIDEIKVSLKEYETKIYFLS